MADDPVLGGRRPPPVGTLEVAQDTPAATQSSQPRRSRRSRRLRSDNWLLPTLTTLIVIGIIEWATRLGPLKDAAIPPPSAIIRELASQVQTDTLWLAILQTLRGWALGLLLAVLVAVPFGLLLGTIPALFQSFKLSIDFLRPIPSIALLPLFILIVGMNMTLKVYIVALGAFFPMLFQTLYGVRDVDPVARDTARAYRLGPVMRFVFVDLMGATPYIATGLRISASVALVVGVATELLVGVPGIGAEVFKAQNAGNTESMYALITATGALGLIIAHLFVRLERATMQWHPAQRESA